jgi:hypothetical protein
MPQKVYVETTIFSYLASRPSGDLVTAAHQRVTAEWWSTAPARFDLVASVVVLQEVTAGDPALAERRVGLLGSIALLGLSPDARDLARQLVTSGAVPPRATADAAHVALATVGAVDYLVTWNLRHLAGAVVRRRLENALRRLGFIPPILCTPEELLPDTREAGGSDV